MNAKKPWIVQTTKAPPLEKDGGASFIGRVREVINVIRGGDPPSSKPAHLVNLTKDESA